MVRRAVAVAALGPALGCGGLFAEVHEEQLAELAAQVSHTPAGPARDGVYDVVRETFVRVREQVSFAQEVTFEVALEDALADGRLDPPEEVVVRNAAPWRSLPLPPGLDRAEREELFDAMVSLAGGAEPDAAEEERAPRAPPDCTLPSSVAGLPRTRPMPDHIAEYVTDEIYVIVRLRPEPTLAEAEAAVRQRLGLAAGQELVATVDGTTDQVVLRRLDVGVVEVAVHSVAGDPRGPQAVAELVDQLRCP